MNLLLLPMMRKVTILDIAQIAGVSRGTVDRVINGRGNVAQEVEKKIKKIASDLGYEKNLMASNLANNRTYNIAVVIPDPQSDIFWRQPREGIKNSLELLLHYGLKIEFYDFNLFEKVSFSMQMENALKTRPDAIITVPTFTIESLDYAEQAQILGIPFITFNTEIKHSNIICYVGQNSYNSGYLAGRLLHMRLKKKEEIIVIHMGLKLANTQHYIDKLEGIKTYFKEKEFFDSKITFYEFENFNDGDKTLAFWNNVKNNHPKLKGIFFTNSRSYKILDLLTQEECSQYVIVGFDLIDPNIALLKSDKIDYIINQNPIQQGFMTIMNFVNHFILNKSIIPTQYLPLDIVLKENVDFYLESFTAFLGKGVKLK